MSHSATLEGTKRYANRFAGRAADGHFREAHGLVVSSLGLGTYLGQPDPKVDASYTAAAVAAAESGINFSTRPSTIAFNAASAALARPSNNSLPKDFPATNSWFRPKAAI